jgi:hypothetical protein
MVLKASTNTWKDKENINEEKTMIPILMEKKKKSVKKRGKIFFFEVFDYPMVQFLIFQLDRDILVFF